MVDKLVWNNYLAYYNFVNFTKDSIKNKKTFLLDFIQKPEYINLVNNISNRMAIAI